MIKATIQRYLPEKYKIHWFLAHVIKLAQKIFNCFSNFVRFSHLQQAKKL